MLYYLVAFCVVALIASGLGFGGIAGMSVQVGWVLAVVAIVFGAVALLGSRRSRSSLP